MTADSRLRYRLMCGGKAHSRWLDNEVDAWKVAVEKGFASTSRVRDEPHYFFGPLVWFEVGHRARAKAKTVPVHDAERLAKLPVRNRPLHPHPAAAR